MYYLRENERHEGPFSMAELRDMARKGAFTGKSLVWHSVDGTRQWVPAGRIPEFVALFHELEIEFIKAAETEADALRSNSSEGAGRSPVTIALGGGKGGVGKTALTASLGLCLTALKQSVILVDCDLGGANLGQALGLPNAPKTSLDFFIRHQATVQDLLTPTGIDGLQLISGQTGVLGLANPKYAQKLKFITQLKKLEADFILLDLGAGAMYDILDFFLSCDRGILVTCPTPLSVKYAFGFLKAATYRGISKRCVDDPIVGEELKNLAARAFQPTMFQFLATLEARSPASAQQVRDYLSGVSRSLILNMVMGRNELADAGRMISDAARRLGLSMDFLGYLSFDAAVRHSVRKLVPFVADSPRARASRELMQIAAEKLLPLRQSRPLEVRAPGRDVLRRLRKYGGALSSGRERAGVTPSLESWTAFQE